LRFVRYADDFILGFTGSKSEAEDIKARLAEFLDSKESSENNVDDRRKIHYTGKHEKWRY